MFSPKTARAARALLGWSQSDLAKAAGIGLSTVVDFEKERRAMPAETETKMARALEAAGIEFQNGGSPGVRLVKGRSRKK
jgi:transcriptional regulator with XRE-family HTH domain